MTRLKDYIFILCVQTKSIRVYEDTTPFDLLMLIATEEMKSPRHLVSSATSECLYVSDYDSSCIWKIALEDHKVTKWMCSRDRPMGISVSNDGQVIAVHSNETSMRRFIGIYGTDAGLIRRIDLSNENYEPMKAILKPNGQFITFHALEGFRRYTLFIGQVTTDGQVISQINVTGRGYGPPSNVLCWSFQSYDPLENYFDRNTYRDCNIYRYVSAYLILEENIIPLRVGWNEESSRRNNIILIDVRVEFEIRSSEINLNIFEC